MRYCSLLRDTLFALPSGICNVLPQEFVSSCSNFTDRFLPYIFFFFFFFPLRVDLGNFSTVFNKLLLLLLLFEDILNDP